MRPYFYLRSASAMVVAGLGPPPGGRGGGGKRGAVGSKVTVGR